MKRTNKNPAGLFIVRRGEKPVQVKKPRRRYRVPGYELLLYQEQLMRRLS